MAMQEYGTFKGDAALEYIYCIVFSLYYHTPNSMVYTPALQQQ